MSRKKIKIAIITPELIPTWGGVGVYTDYLVRELAKYKDIDIHIFTPYRGENKDEIARHFLNRVSIHYLTRAKDQFLFNAKFQWAIFRHFPTYYRKHKYDLIHSTSLVQMPDILLKFRRLPVPSVVTLHTTIEGQVKGFLQSNKNFFKMAPTERLAVLTYPLVVNLQRFYLRNTPYVLTVSKKYLPYLKNAAVTYNGIDFRRFSYCQISDKFDFLKDKKRIVLFVGRLITQKGIEDFVKLMARVEGYFVIAGKGGEKQFLKLIHKYRIPKEKFAFLGYVPNHLLSSLYARCHLYVLPSYYENFPFTLLEAMSMKCVCISYNVGAVDEIIEDGVNGYLVRVGDIETLIQKVEYLLADEGVRKRMAERGYLKIVNNFTAQRMAAATKQAYEIILNGGRLGS